MAIQHLKINIQALPFLKTNVQDLPSILACLVHEVIQHLFSIKCTPVTPLGDTYQQSCMESAPSTKQTSYTYVVCR